MANKAGTTQGAGVAAPALVLGAGWQPLRLVEGQGCWVTADDGRRYLDCQSQAWTLNLGHAHPEVLEAAFSQAQKLSHMRGGFPNDVREELAERLAELAPGALGRVSFSVSGSTAVEGALKLAMINRPGSQRFISLWHAYHGNTLAALAAGWMATGMNGHPGPAYKFKPFMNNFVRIPNAYCYRCYFGHRRESCGLECAHHLRRTIRNATDGPPIAFIMEPMQGNGGQIDAPEEYMRQVRRICDEEGVLLIFDEIQTAFGRTGSMFAAEHYGVTPDVMSVAKALGNGFPVAATIFDEGLEGFAPTGEDVHTFANNAMCFAAALKTLEILIRDNLPGRAAEMGAYLTNGLREIQEEFAQIGDVRGPGLFIGIELVKDPETKEPAAEETERFLREALGRGVLLAGAGAVPNVVKIKPPLVIAQEEADLVLEAFRDSMKATFTTRGGSKA